MANVHLDGLVEVESDLPNGVYCLGGKSAVGKTYLCKVLKKYHNAGDNVDSYTYDDLLNKLSPPSHGDLIIFDRYDLYSESFRTEISDLSKHGVILLDMKRPQNKPVKGIRKARINFDESGKITIK